MNFLFTNTPLKFFIDSIWRDEAFSYLLAKKDILSILKLTALDSNPPFYYFLLHFWIKIFGAGEVALRVLSLTFFWATLYVFFLILRDVLKIKERPALVYTLLFLINPFLNYYAFEARMYSLFAFLTTLSFYFLFTKRQKAYLITLVLGLYTHYFMFFVLLGQVCIEFLLNKKTQASKSLKTVLKSLLLFVPWLIFVLSNWSHSIGTWILKPDIKNVLDIPMAMYTGFEWHENYSKYFLQIKPIISLLFLSIFIVGFMRWKKDRESLAKFYSLLIWSLGIPLVIFFIAFFVPYFLPRYLIFSSVGMIILLIFLLERMAPIQKAFFLTLLVVLTLNYNSIQVKHREKPNLRKVVYDIKSISDHDDLLYVSSELDFHSAQYYFGEDRVFIYNKSYDEIPWYVGRILIPKNKITSNIPVYPKKVFIIKQDLNYEITTRLPQ